MLEKLRTDWDTYKLNLLNCPLNILTIKIII